MHNMKDPSFFRTKTIEATYGLIFFVITPHFNSSWNNHSISILWWWGYLYGLTLIGLDPGLTSIICSILLWGSNSMGSSWNTFLCFWIISWMSDVLESSCYDSCISMLWNWMKYVVSPFQINFSIYCDDTTGVYGGWKPYNL